MSAVILTAWANRICRAGAWHLLCGLAVGMLVGCRAPASVAPDVLTRELEPDVAAETRATEYLPAVSAPPAQAIPWIIAAERRAAGAGQLALLDFLWAEDGLVVDRRGEKNSARHYRWEGKDAVLNRYVVAVFAHAPPPLAENALAHLVLPPDGPPAENRRLAVVNGADRWLFVWRDDRWWILELSYSS